MRSKSLAQSHPAPTTIQILLRPCVIMGWALLAGHALATENPCGRDRATFNNGLWTDVFKDTRKERHRERILKDTTKRSDPCCQSKIETDQMRQSRTSIKYCALSRQDSARSGPKVIPSFMPAQSSQSRKGRTHASGNCIPHTKVFFTGQALYA